ncbi:hypothetical protein [uncultured Methanoregula sp.]|uniref:hypothetical protein n=1 Tax=uncultured Methanoregula sp. TaxID=1005933 RepID=UPI00374890D3
MTSGSPHIPAFRESECNDNQTAYEHDIARHYPAGATADGIHRPCYPVGEVTRPINRELLSRVSRSFFGRLRSAKNCVNDPDNRRSV